MDSTTLILIIIVIILIIAMLVAYLKMMKLIRDAQNNATNMSEEELTAFENENFSDEI